MLEKNLPNVLYLNISDVVWIFHNQAVQFDWLIAVYTYAAIGRIWQLYEYACG
jgi:hypothetical protein